MNDTTTKPLVLITGATGYVGGRLLHELEKQGYRLRCLTRHPEQLEGRLPPHVEVVEGNVQDKDLLIDVLGSVDVAYYLVHSMDAKGDFSELDRQAAANFGHAASQCGVKRIIYLGGLGNSYDNLSPHLRSRQEVGQVLRNTADNVQVIEFRASIVIGSGSLSFEMIRALVDRLPIMITPEWVWKVAQPIAINDLLKFLIDAIEIPVEGNQIFEIGGADKVSYAGIMNEYGQQKGLKRYMLRVPVLTPWLSSLWLGLITPLYARVGRKLVESAKNDTIVHDPLANRFFNFQPMGIKEAVEQAIANENQPHPMNRWIDSTPVSTQWDETHFGKQITDQREQVVDLSPDQLFRSIQGIGGKTGYYYLNLLWKIRGAMDVLLGGVGLRRGRRHPEDLQVGDVVDFWRVEALEPNRRLLLRAEMKVPGRAWLEFTVEPQNKKTLFKQTARFDPAGVVGILYWYILYPVHYFIFSGLMKGIIKSAKEKST